MLISRQLEDESWTEAATLATLTPFDVALRFCATTEGSYRIYTISTGLAAEVIVWPDRVEMTLPRAVLLKGD